MCSKTNTFQIFNRSRACVTCLLITNERTTDDQLALIRVKHLRAYLLHSNIISVNRLRFCIEKQDLIDLIQSRKGRIPYENYDFVDYDHTRNTQISNGSSIYS
ncbi:unnamed protein product, partial [Rotaria sp. Silwood2]